MLNSIEIETALSAAQNPVLLETHEQLALAAIDWSQTEILGIDTEFLRERTYWAELGLVQVSDGHRAWLVDVIKIEDLEPLKRMFEDQGILKVFHSSSEDFEALWHALGVSPQPVVDTQVACAMTGQPLQMSYHNAIKWLTGIEVDKDQTRSNWLRRPLSPRQLHYAATDVVFLPALVRQVQNTLLEQNKVQWLEEDVSRAIQQSRESLHPQHAYLRLGGAASLEPRQLQVLRTLAAWREQQATNRNLARGFVITDTELMLLSRQIPDSLDQLAGIEGLHERTIKKHGDALLTVVRAGLSSTEPLAAIQALDKNQKRIVGEMRKLVQAEADAHGIDPALLASRKVLETLLWAVENGTDIPERLTGWRFPVITEKLISLIQPSG